MATREEKQIATLKLALFELRRTYDHISNTYDQLRLKVLALLGGEVAVASFIFSGDSFLPKTVYGKIYFFTGVGLLIISFLLFLWSLSSMTWAIPCDLDEMEQMKRNTHTEIKLLEFIKTDYLTSINHCMPRVRKRIKVIDNTLYVLSVGVIMLLVLKFGG